LKLGLFYTAWYDMHYLGVQSMNKAAVFFNNVGLEAQPLRQPGKTCTSRESSLGPRPLSPSRKQYKDMKAHAHLINVIRKYEN
jgi:hypothetical protein